MSKFLLTASLLNSWKYCVDNGTIEDFLTVLNREPTEATEAMQKGNEFEAWAIENLDELKGGAYQLVAYKEIDGFLLYGRLDVLKCGTVYEIKYTGSYAVGKFYGSYQTPMYLALVPEAHRMVYIIGNTSENIYREEYTPAEVEPIEGIIKQFTAWLEANGLLTIYQTKWKARD